jgi:hypothetical protein
MTRLINAMKETETFNQIQVGDLALYHGTVCEVIEKVRELGFIIKNEAGEPIAYNAKWKIEPVLKRIWILEQ